MLQPKILYPADCRLVDDFFIVFIELRAALAKLKLFISMTPQRQVHLQNRPLFVDCLESRKSDAQS